MDYPSPEMRGKCWITIIRSHSFHKSIHLIGMFSLFWMARAVTVTSSVFCSIKHTFILISSGSENYSERTQRMIFSAAIAATLASSEQCSTHHRFSLINVLHRFVGTERRPALFRKCLSVYLCLYRVYMDIEMGSILIKCI